MKLVRLFPQRLRFIKQNQAQLYKSDKSVFLRTHNFSHESLAPGLPRHSVLHFYMTEVLEVIKTGFSCSLRPPENTVSYIKNKSYLVHFTQVRTTQTKQTKNTEICEITKTR